MKVRLLEKKYCFQFQSTFKDLKTFGKKKTQEKQEKM